MSTAGRRFKTYNALNDIGESFSDWRLWALRAFWDIRRRYQEHILGPLWITAGLLGTSLGLGYLYSQLFKIELTTFLPYVTAGLMAWGFIDSVIRSSVSAFTSERSTILNASGPLSALILRVVMRELIVLAHNFIVMIGVLIFVKMIGQVRYEFLAPAILLVTINLIWMGLLSATISVEFPDFGQAIGFLMVFAMFITPLFWYVGDVGPRAGFISFNPFYHFVTLIRDPLIGKVPEMKHWITGLGLAAGGWVTAIALFMRARPKIALWV
jgi:ABC-type polysaccharide/polyol phosphate export permease